MARPDLNALAVFATVVEANGFAAAARLLRMPTSTVSRRIADLEAQLGVRLLERSTRSLRLTDVGAELVEHARRSAALGKAVDDLVSDRATGVTGTLRVSAPPSIAESLLVPMVTAFQAAYPEVRVHVLVTERAVDQVEEGVDLVFRFGTLKDSSLIARPILRYRHQLVATPAYLAAHGAPTRPEELRAHRLLAFSRWRPDARWKLRHAGGTDTHTLTFVPHLSLNDYSGLATALLTGAGIGDLPPIVQPELLRTGQLVEVMPEWRFETFELSVIHLGRAHVPRRLRLFKAFAAQQATQLFPTLPA